MHPLPGHHHWAVPFHPPQAALGQPRPQGSKATWNRKQKNQFLAFQFQNRPSGTFGRDNRLNNSFEKMNVDIRANFPASKWIKYSKRGELVGRYSDEGQHTSHLGLSPTAWGATRRKSPVSCLGLPQNSLWRQGTGQGRGRYKVCQADGPGTASLTGWDQRAASGFL